MRQVRLSIARAWFVGLLSAMGCSLDRLPEGDLSAPGTAPSGSQSSPTAPPMAVAAGATSGLSTGPNPPTGPTVQMNTPTPCSGVGCGDGTVASGLACASHQDCESGYCNDGLCCGGGRCCTDDQACGTGSAAAVCDDPEHCQGHRGVAQCVDFQCVVTGTPADDDSDCAADLQANDCGPYRAVLCTGEVDQGAPQCADACASDSDCDDDAHCFRQQCELDLPDGAGCTESAECSSGHCNGGLCCAEGNCCKAAADCPAYAAQCESAETCQGSRPSAECNPDYRCVEGPLIEDDSACDETILALNCSDFADVSCTGAEVQTAPRCGTFCAQHADCDAEMYCYLGSCRPDEPNGGLCQSDQECASDYCRNWRCCDGGECCTLDSTCQQQLGAAPACDDEASCTGHWDTAFCDWTTYSCVQQTLDTNIGCDPVIIADCTPYQPGPLTCGDAAGPFRPRCPTGCASNNDCLAPNQCIRNVCRLECENDAGCELDQRCARNRCVYPCDVAADCPGGMICDAGSCRPECVNSNQCPGERVCRENRCIIEENQDEEEQ